jgi:flagellar export protein FliJ
MAFRFPLATVLLFRQSVEKREEIALQKLLLEMARTRHEIEDITAAMAAAHEARNQAMLNSLPAAHIHGMVNEMEAAAERRIKLLELLSSLESERQAQTRKYQAAHRDRQMLSDMELRQRDTYELERARATQKFLDDIFAARLQRS